MNKDVERITAVYTTYEKCEEVIRALRGLGYYIQETIEIEEYLRKLESGEMPQPIAIIKTYDDKP